MSEGFIPLAAFLRPPPAVLDPETTEIAVEAVTQTVEVADEYTPVFSAIRRFQAGIADALDVAVERLLAQIAESVVARELQIAPADIAAIVAKARQRAHERVVLARVHPAQRGALATLNVETLDDDRLDAGDVVLELRSGTIDLRLRTRLAMAVAASAP